MAMGRNVPDGGTGDAEAEEPFAPRYAIHAGPKVSQRTRGDEHGKAP